VVIGPKHEPQSGAEFRTALRQALIGQRETFTTAGIDQVVVVARDDFAIMWLHGSRPELAVGLEFLSGILDSYTVLPNTRVVCVDEPPTLNISSSAAYNFIFLREAKYFLT